MSFVLLEKRGHVAIMTLNRPEVLNAMNKELSMQLFDTLDQVENDDDIYVAILTGAGRAFLAGADIAANLNASSFNTAVDSAENSRLAMRIQNLK